MTRRYLFLFSVLLLNLFCRAQAPVRVDVDLAKPEGKFAPIYSWFGYDESGYTTTKNGQALLVQLHNLSPVPVYIRAHFLLATGDDPEDDRLDARVTAPNAERLISGEQVRELQALIDDTGTELERVLAYYKVGSLSELTETAYRRAIEVLNRKLAKRGDQETIHAHD